MNTKQGTPTLKAIKRKPCSDCPWRRKSLPGWLGDEQTPEMWIASAHGEAIAECHTRPGSQCNGMAIYRANVLKQPRYPDILQQEKDTENVFSSPVEFIEHHRKCGITSAESQGILDLLAERKRKREEFQKTATRLVFGDHGFSVSPVRLQEIQRTLVTGKSVSFHPSGFGIGVRVSRKNISSPYAGGKVSDAETLKVLGDKPLYYDTFDCD